MVAVFDPIPDPSPRLRRRVTRCGDLAFDVNFGGSGIGKNLAGIERAYFAERNLILTTEHTEDSEILFRITQRHCRLGIR